MRKILAAGLMFFALTMPAWAAMPLAQFITYSGVKIAVYQSAGKQGPGILMIHGNTSAANSYSRVFDAEFVNSLRVVAMDLPGFDQSGKAPSYNVGFLAGAIAKVAHHFNVESGVLVGWSLGGDLVLQAASLLPHTKGFFLFGTAPIGYTPNLPPPFLSPTESYAGQAVNFGFIANLTPTMITQYVTAFFSPKYPVPSIFVTDGLKTDPNTRAAVFAAATGQDPTFHDEVVIVKSLKQPVAILLADHDAFLRPAYLQALAPQIPTLWNHQITIVSNSGHASHWEQTDTFISLLRNFVRSLGGPASR
jgi:pimeloyl-ACP methyl ester carboxylesterase